MFLETFPRGPVKVEALSRMGAALAGREAPGVGGSGDHTSGWMLRVIWIVPSAFRPRGPSYPDAQMQWVVGDYSVGSVGFLQGISGSLMYRFIFGLFISL